MKPVVLALAALLLAACEQAAAPTAAGAAQATAGDAVRPLPALTGRVVDMANLLPAATEVRFTRQLEQLEAATTDQLVVVTVPSLDGEPIDSLGLRLGNGWGIGQRDLDNGVLLIVAPNDRKARIEVGSGLEGLLTDERAQEIMDSMLVPAFREARYEQGISAGLMAIESVLRSEPRRPQPRGGAPAS